MENLSSQFVYKLRADLKQIFRDFFALRNYLEVDTPVVVKTPGTEINLNYFETEWSDHQSKSHQYYLRSSPELHLKKALSFGLPRIFEFAKCFRNHGELSNWHNPEFTMLEWYETGISYFQFMNQTQELLNYSVERMKSLHGNAIINHLSEGFKKISVEEAFQEFAGIKLEDLDKELAAKAVAQKVLSVKPSDDFETAFYKTLLEKIEPALEKLGAVILYDYPASMAVLAKIEDGTAKRFEFYINGVELCNAFEELLDANQNKSRVTQSNLQRQKLGKPIIPEDNEFYSALENGIPPSCGNALGFDRWLALLTGSKSIDAVVPFSFKK